MARASSDLLFRFADVHHPARSADGDSGPWGAACCTGCYDAAAAWYDGALLCDQLDQLAQSQDQWQALGCFPGICISSPCIFTGSPAFIRPSVFLAVGTIE